MTSTGSPGEPAIRVRGLRNRYGAREVLGGVDLDVRFGELVALLGPNGAGKTTTVEILEGYRRADDGEALVLGIDPARGGTAWRARIGLMLQGGGVDPRVTPREALRLGLVSRVVPDAELLGECLAIAEGMCKFSPYGLQMTKQVIWANLENPSLHAAIELEDRNQLMLGMTDNLPEPIRSFDQEREPVYTDESRRDLYRTGD